MRQPIWKLAALVGISGFGFLGLLQVQKNLHDRGMAGAAETAPEAPRQKVGTARVVSQRTAPGRVRIQQSTASDPFTAAAPGGIDFRDEVANGESRELLRSAEADLKPIPDGTNDAFAAGAVSPARQAANVRNQNEPKPIITPAGFESSAKPAAKKSAPATKQPAEQPAGQFSAAASESAPPATPATDMPADFGPDPFAAFGPTPDTAASGLEDRPAVPAAASPSELLEQDDPFATRPAATPADAAAPAAPSDAPAEAVPSATFENDDPFGGSPTATNDSMPSAAAADPAASEAEPAAPVDPAGDPAPAAAPFELGDDPFGGDPFGDAPTGDTSTSDTSTSDASPMAESPAAVEPMPSDTESVDPVPTRVPAERPQDLSSEPAADAATGDAPGSPVEPMPAEQPASSDPFGGDPSGADPFGAGPTTPSTATPESDPALDFGDGNSVPIRPAGDAREPAAPAAGPTNDDASPRRLPESSDLNGIGTVSPDDPQGPQHAELNVEKKAPPTATIGQPLVYEIIVTNVGDSPAHEVTVSDVVPKGMTLGGTSPQAEMNGKLLVWKLDTLEPGQSTTIKIKATPTEPGMLGSVATVNFVSAIAARTQVVAPHLTLKVSVPPQVAVGQPVDFHFEIGNDGNAAAEGVLLRNVLPAGFQHADGNDLEYEVGVLPPGKTESVTLHVAAVKPGSFQNNAVLTATGGMKSEAVSDVKVASQKVTVSRQGPKRRYVGRPATYANTVKNASQEIVSGLKVFEQVPEGLEFVQASHGGQFDPDNRTVAWQVGVLRPGQEQTLQVVLTAAKEGVQDSVVHVEESSGGSVEVASATEVQPMPSLAPTMQTPDGPIVVGERAALQISIKNRGNADAAAVAIALGLPPQLKLVEARGGQVQPAPNGSHVVQFRSPLAAGGEQTVHFIVEGVAPGTARIHAEVDASHMDKPLVKDEELAVTARR